MQNREHRTTKRWAITHKVSDPDYPENCRFIHNRTFPDRETAEERIRLMRQNNAPHILAMFGTPDTLEAREVDCWVMTSTGEPGDCVKQFMLDPTEKKTENDNDQD